LPPGEPAAAGPEKRNTFAHLVEITLRRYVRTIETVDELCSGAVRFDDFLLYISMNMAPGMSSGNE
jgi:hypothetical protein